jgi:ADP-ribose pyrophosphatase YjhB (NUDIX family)
MPKTKRALAGCIITDTVGGVMVLHRAATKQWEFPGGIMTADETPALAAARNTFDSMGVEINIIEKLGERTFDDVDSECDASWFKAEITSGSPRLHDTQTYDKWGYFSLVALTQRYDELSPGIKSFLEAMAYDEIVLDI